MVNRQSLRSHSKRTSLRGNTSVKKDSSVKRSRRSVSSLRKSSKRRSKHVQINTPENQVQEYSLHSSEKEWKQNTPIKGIPKCDKNDLVFPCKKKRTIFKTKKEYNNYKKLISSRKTEKSRSEHYDDISTLLESLGFDFSRK